MLYHDNVFTTIKSINDNMVESAVVKCIGPPISCVSSHRFSFIDDTVLVFNMLFEGKWDVGGKWSCDSAVASKASTAADATEG